jgi:hypothetical protein
MQTRVSETSELVHQEEFQDQPNISAEPSLLPRFRRTFRLFSERGIMTCGGGVVSGELKIQLRKGFMNKTKVMVSYASHRVFVEVEGSPLEGDIHSMDVLNSLRHTGMIAITPVSQDHRF